MYHSLIQSIDEEMFAVVNEEFQFYSINFTCSMKLIQSILLIQQIDKVRIMHQSQDHNHS